VLTKCPLRPGRSRIDCIASFRAKYVRLLASGVVAFAVASCGSPSTASDAPETADADGDATRSERDVSSTGDDASRPERDGSRSVKDGSPSERDASRSGEGDGGPRSRDAASDVGEAGAVEAGRDVMVESGYDASDGRDGGDGSDSSQADAGQDGGFLPGRPEVVCEANPATAPETSTFIVDASVPSTDSIDLPSTGDLWPSCWSGDALYAAWGDGYGFDVQDAGQYPRPDIGVARILGDPGEPDAMSGQSLVYDGVAEQAIFKVWTSGSYYQKPTGMLCLGGKMYLAVQDLNDSDYGDAPAATLAVSSDSGLTWLEDRTAPMFSNHEFTTMFFLDYGQDSSAIGSYVYVYGLDYNWRWSVTVRSPQGLYLARIPVAADLLDRTTWEFFAGSDSQGNPTWSGDLAKRLPVLVDCTRRYVSATFPGYTVIAQGSVVYDVPFQRYLYTSWTDLTYEFYEAPEPWGPWRKFLYEDFGPYPWTPENNGGYAATVPSKYIADGGAAMWVQSNTWSSGVVHNDFSLRSLQIAR